MARPAPGIPQDIGEHMRLMCDIMVLAFQTDTTRVCTLKLNNDHSSLRFPNLGVDYMIHHLLSHKDTEDWLKVNNFFFQQFGVRLAVRSMGDCLDATCGDSFASFASCAQPSLDEGACDEPFAACGVASSSGVWFQ